MQNKRHYVLGIITGIFAAGALFIAMSSFFPNLLRPSATPMPQVLSIGTKVDEILSVMNSYYVEEIDMEDLADKIYRETVNLINDPYSAYMDTKQLADFMEDTEGVYAGIGVSVTVDTEKNQIKVVVPFEGYPGAKAGILPGDAIIKVNGYDVTGEMLQEAVNMMKGTPGTSVTITVFRESAGETFDMTIVRESINVPTVSHKTLENKIGYIRITQFERVTYDQFANALNDLKKQDIKGLIIDLRNNPGGLMNIVTDIADLLVPDGTIVYTEDKLGNRNTTKSDKNYLGLPLLLLVNNYSASASEILAGAVRDFGVGELIGTKTYGKGLVQTIFQVADGSAVKVTIAKYYTPSGVCLQGAGLEPDYEIDMDLELTVRLSSLSDDEDIQLTRAVEIMNEKINK